MINTKLSVCDNTVYPNFSPYYNKIYNSPIFRSGIIASDPKLDYSGVDDKTKSKRIAYEGFSFNGASGSPIFATQKGFKLGKGLINDDNSFYIEIKLIGKNAGIMTNQILTY